MANMIIRLFLRFGLSKLVGGKAARNARQVQRVARMAQRMRK